MSVMPTIASREVTVVLFEQFELLDVFGPVELLSKVPELRITWVADSPGPVTSSQGVRVIAEQPFTHDTRADILLVPGGAGTRQLVHDSAFLTRLTTVAKTSHLVTSVCTGSALLAAAGCLESYRATSNKLAFEWVRGHGHDVDWVVEARWVHDRDRWTSSGVAAGMDMTAALIAHLYGDEVARSVTQHVEYEPQRNADHDPFASLYGLVDR